MEFGKFKEISPNYGSENEMPPKRNKIHHLKVLTKYYNDLKNGNKTFEIRKNDRDFRTGDILVLSEYDLETKEYTASKNLYFKVTYILNNTTYLQKGYVCMGIRECISFNYNGFIGFCGWADGGNTAPIVAAFKEWCDSFGAMLKEGEQK